MGDAGHWRTAALFAEMVFLRASLPVLKHAVTLERLIQFLGSPRACARDHTVEQRVVRLARRLWRGSEGPCLERSLALYRVLGRAGARPMLIYGIGQGDERLAGHAWVEVDGETLVDAAGFTARYTVLNRYASSGERLGPRLGAGT